MEKVGLDKIATGVSILVAVAVVFLEFESASRHIVAWVISGLFTLLALALSLLDIHEHFQNYVQPSLQRYAVRIIFMIPVYGIESWLALRFKEDALILTTARECYEAYTIHAFFKLLEGYLVVTKVANGRGHLVNSSEEETEHHMKPFCCLRPWNLKKEFVTRCRNGVFQYVFVKVFVTLTTFFLVSIDMYGEGELANFEKGYLYLTVLTNISQTWAMYCLILFYHTLEKPLHSLGPFPKLLCIKAVVFLTFWQSMMIAVVGEYGLLQPSGEYSEADIEWGLSNFLICVEMFLASLAHRIYFSYKDYAGLENPKRLSYVGAVVDIGPQDLLADLTAKKQD